MDSLTIGLRAWRDLGGATDALAVVEAPDPGVALASRLDVAGMLGDCVALATLALQEVQLARGQRTTVGPVRVDGRRVTTAAQSERHLRIDGSSPEVWAPLSGFWRAADGWVRTHGNYPHHASRLARVLGVAAAAGRDEVAHAIGSWSAVDLEDEATAAGAIVGAVRSPDAWATHPQAVALSTAPLVGTVRLPGGSGGTWTAGADAPLSGVRVLDLTRVLAGPVATRNLAHAGADVLRIDSPQLPEIGWVHLDTGAGKSTATLDLRSEPDRRVLDALLAQADVVVTGYRPGALDPFGLSPAALAERRPGIVVGSVSAWGAEGPWATKRGFDSIVQAVTGIASVESPDGERPGALPAQALDHSAGHLLTAGIVRSLRQQRDEGGSWHVGVALATLARDLLRTTATTAAPAEAVPTLQVGETPAGRLTCAAPVLTFPGAPADYPALARPWGSDEPAWREAPDVRC